MFYQRPAVEQWLLLEADPAVVTFCEWPAYAQIDGSRRLADFWVRYGDREELVLLDRDARHTPPFMARKDSATVRRLNAAVAVQCGILFCLMSYPPETVR
ncbi:hypothetical protein [Cupriavidus necator]|uniref:hypothetical protein n=1 Tax=Cupriavidus necator TaxID=106590 RepID=UPI0038B2C33A